MNFLLVLIASLSLLWPLAVAQNDVTPWRLLSSGRSFTRQECLMCKFSTSLVNYALKTHRGEDQVQRFSNSFCALAHIQSPLVCSNITKLFNHEIVKIVSSALVTPDQICGYLSNNTCGTFHDPLADWEVNLNVSATLNQQELSKMRKIQMASREPQKPFKIIHISDTHIDLNYKEGSIANCADPLCCRNSSKASANQSTIAAGYWGTYGNCDVPLRTLESALKKLNATMGSDEAIKYVVWTGDIQPHDVWQQSKDFAIRTYDSVFSKIFQYLPGARIFPTLGNHEMVPVDQFSPSNMLDIARDDSPEWLYRKLDSFWSRWLPDDTVETITKDGFYAVTVQTGLKIISLNTNFCDNKNFWLYINSTDPGNQLQWLVHELQISELLHEQVHIIGHVPPGVNDCLKVWSRNFNRILRRFSETVAGQFYGHTHNNEFEIFYDQESLDSTASRTSRLSDATSPSARSSNLWNPISVGFIGPSITTFIDLNPGFRVYTIDPNQSYMPIDIESYYMNITAANSGALAGPILEPDWISSGMFTTLFSINDTSPRSLHNLLIEMVSEIKEEKVYYTTTSLDQLIFPYTPTVKEVDVATSKLYKLYRLSNSFSDIFGETAFAKISNDQKKSFICKFFTGQSHNPNACNLFISESMPFDDVQRFW